MTVNAREAAGLLLQHDNIVILAHRKPDGDTMGSAFGLLYALEAVGKTARVECEDPIPERYAYLHGERPYEPARFQMQYVVAVDVADAPLLGALAERYPNVDLCIDHHGSNTMYANNTLLDARSASASGVIYRVVLELGIRPDKRIADALFTGLTTDTGCFRHDNVTVDTYLLAAELMACGADQYEINKRMFDTQTFGRMEVEKLVLQGIELHHGGKCAIVALPPSLPERYGVSEEDLDGISALPRRIEGVKVGVTLRQNSDGSFRVSLRADRGVNASRIGAVFGGGGHPGAAGCTLTGSLPEVKARLLQAVGRELEECGA